MLAEAGRRHSAGGDEDAAFGRVSKDFRRVASARAAGRYVEPQPLSDNTGNHVGVCTSPHPAMASWALPGDDGLLGQRPALMNLGRRRRK